MYSILDYDFELPPELIADEPLEERDASRMLTVDRSAARFDDDRFERLPEILRGGDLLVINNTRVFPARLIGRSDTGARVEVFLISENDDGTWTTLAKPARRLKPGKRISFDSGFAATTVDRLAGGQVIVQFEGEGDIFENFERFGRTPLPPYIKRSTDDSDRDRDRYQTVYARHRGSIAAPTAGLHFTEEIIGRLRSKDVEIAELTLHVGYGTFEPVRTDDLREHSVAPEQFSISEDASEKLRSAKRSGRRIIAVGTTTTRTLEYVMAKYGDLVAASGHADLTILPGHRFEAIDGLITNFHLPKSSLLVLVSTFAGRELIMRAYRHAVASGYRFYSYGDCMLIT